MTEIVQIIMVMTTTHALCSFALGCGIVPEIDLVGGITISTENSNAVLPSSASAKNRKPATSLIISHINIHLGEDPLEIGRSTEELLKKLQSDEYSRSSSPVHSPSPKEEQCKSFESADETDTSSADASNLMRIASGHAACDA